MENILLLIYALGVLATFIVLIVQAISAFKGLKLETENKFQSISMYTIFIGIIISLFVWLSWVAILGFILEYMENKKKKKELSN